MKKVCLILGAAVIVFVFGIILYKTAENKHKTKSDIYQEKALKHLYPCLFSAIDGEFFKRAYQSGEPYDEWMSVFNGDSIYETKTIVVPDTTFQVRIKKGDLRAHFAIRQFILKGYNPVKLNILDSIYRRELRSEGIIPQMIYTEYVDIKKNRVIESYGENPKKKYFKMDVHPIDILVSVGIRCTLVLAFPEFRETLKGYISYFLSISISIFALSLTLCFWR